MAIYDNGLNPALPGYTSNQTSTSSAPPGSLILNGQLAYNGATGQPTVPVNVTPTTKTTSDTFTQPAKTAADVLSKVNENMTFQQQRALLQQQAIDYLNKYEQKDPQIQEYQNLYNKQQTSYDKLGLDAANVNLRAQAGINAVEPRVIPMQFIRGEQEGLMKQANLQLQSLGVQQQAAGIGLNATARQLETLTANRNEMLKAYQLALSFGRDDLNLSFQLQQAQKAEEQFAMKFASENNIQKPYFKLGDTIYPTGGGGGFTSPEDFATRTGMTLQDAEARGLIQTEIQTPAERQMAFEREKFEWQKTQGNTSKWAQIGVDDMGNPRYGFVNESNQTVTPFGGSINSTGVEGIDGNSWLDSIGTITAPNGSSLWKHGLDIDLQDGQSLTSPVGGTVTFAGSTSNGFGNQVRIKMADGNEMWFSHLKNPSVNVGDVVSAGQLIGLGGKTGNVIPIGGGDGSHLDLTIKKPDGSYFSAPEVEKYIRNLSGGTASPEVKVIQDALKTLATNPKLDQKDRMTLSNTINSYLKAGDIEQATRTLIMGAINGLPAESQNKILGKFTAVEQLIDISGMLKEFAAAGGSTNIFTGTTEQIAQKLGTTSDPRLAEIGARINAAMFAYRNAVSGAAFTESETEAYTKLFPGTGKTGALNDALIAGILASFRTDIGSTLNITTGGQYPKLQQLLEKSVDPYQQYLKDLANPSAEEAYLDSILGPQQPEQNSPLTSGFSTGGLSVGYDPESQTINPLY